MSVYRMVLRNAHIARKPSERRLSYADIVGLRYEIWACLYWHRPN
nr:MAG TPA: hypothetical protein [Caudoviricetes sp.]